MDAPARRAPDLFKPTLVAGLVFGAAAGLPGPHLLDLCLCALAWGAGIGAAFLHARACRAAGLPFRPGEGAKIGFLAGVIYALAATTMFLLLLAVIGGSEELLRAANEVHEQLPGWVSEETLAGMRALARTGWLPAVAGGMVLAAHLVAGAIFSTLGGLLGASFFKVEAPPPTPPAPR